MEKEEHSKEEIDGTTLAPDGKVWVCTACGKLSKSQYGFDKDGKSTAITYGWDESCMLNSILVDMDKCIFGESDRVIEII